MTAKWAPVEMRLKAIAQASDDKMASDVVILNVAEISGIADFFFICSGQNVRQTKTIADEVEARLLALKSKPLHTEGRESGRWILMDCDDIIVFIFLPEIREFYDLEGLWGDARSVNVSELLEKPARQSG